jgi:serine/threonine protein kinase
MSVERIDKYKIIEEVGRGGMAVVYKAEDTSLGRVVALKLLHPYLAEDNQARIRLQSEARAVASLKHDLIPDVYDFSGTESKHAYIVTEFVDGVTLATFVKNQEFKLAESALLVLHQITTALNHAHNSGIIHRDLKPENIMISNEGQIKLMDFGISRIVENPGITTTGQILGSPAFMAPEIIKGKVAGKPADIFSLGILLYQLSTGVLPFQGSNPHAVLIKIAESEYPDPESINPEIGTLVAKLINKCLSLSPEDRPESTEVLMELIEEILGYSGLEARNIPKLCCEVLQDPDKMENSIKPKIIQSLILLSEKQFKKPLGGQIISRLLSLDPGNEQVVSLFERLQKKQRMVTQKAVLGGVALLVIIVGLLYISLRSNTTSDISSSNTSYRKKNKKTQIASSMKNVGINVIEPLDDMGSMSSFVDPPLSYHPDGTALAVNSMNPTNSMKSGTMKSVMVMSNGHIRPMVKFVHPPLMRKFPQPYKNARSFSLFPFPQGQVTIVLDGKLLGLWGPRAPSISKIRVSSNSHHTLIFKHPLCYNQTINITPEMNSQKIARRLRWRPARVVVQAPAGVAIAIKILEGSKRTISGNPNSPMAVAFPHIWNSPMLKAKIIVAGKNYKTKEKLVTLRAGKLLRINF